MDAVVRPRALGLHAAPDPHFFLRELFVELRQLHLFSFEHRLLAHEKRVVVASPADELAAVHFDDTRVASFLKNARSCVTNSNAPPHSNKNSSSHWIDARSRWFVGSSRSSNCGASTSPRASSTRRFCPADNAAKSCSAGSPMLSINLLGERSRRSQSSRFLGSCRHRLRRPSAPCPRAPAGTSCRNVENTAPACRNTCPLSASSSPEIAFIQRGLARAVAPDQAQARSPRSIWRSTRSSNGAPPKLKLTSRRPDNGHSNPRHPAARPAQRKTRLLQFPCGLAHRSGPCTLAGSEPIARDDLQRPRPRRVRAFSRTDFRCGHRRPRHPPSRLHLPWHRPRHHPRPKRSRAEAPPFAAPASPRPTACRWSWLGPPGTERVYGPDLLLAVRDAGRAVGLERHYFDGGAPGCPRDAPRQTHRALPGHRSRRHVFTTLPHAHGRRALHVAPPRSPASAPMSSGSASARRNRKSSWLPTPPPSMPPCSLALAPPSIFTPAASAKLPVGSNAAASNGSSASARSPAASPRATSSPILLRPPCPRPAQRPQHPLPPTP